MPTTYLFAYTLRCLRVGGYQGSPDHVALVIKPTTDGVALARWPKVDTMAMEKDDSVTMQVEVRIDALDEVVIQLWHYRNDGPDGVLYGEYTLPIDPSAPSSIITLQNEDEGDVYELTVGQSATAANRVWPLTIQCIVPSSAIDADVIDAVMTAIGGATEKFADSLGNVPDPRAQAVATAVGIAGGVLSNVPNIAKAITAAKEYADQLVVTLGQNEISPATQIYPTKGYVNFTSNHLVDVSYAQIAIPAGSPVELRLWDADHSSSDDDLGSFVASTVPGTYLAAVTSSRHGSAFLVGYSVLPPDVTPPV
jgi:hypothetical protein